MNSGFFLSDRAVLSEDLPPAPSRWIPVSERLPQNGVEVLTYPGWAAGESGVSLDQWCDEWNCFLMSIEDGHRITHWMPMPLPPEAEPVVGPITQSDPK